MRSTVGGSVVRGNGVLRGINEFIFIYNSNIKTLNIHKTIIL